MALNSAGPPTRPQISINAVLKRCEGVPVGPNALAQVDFQAAEQSGKQANENGGE